jgi:predicted CoA-binding protein
MTKRLPSHGQMNSKTAAQPDTPKRSAGDRRNPTAAGVAAQPAERDQTNPSPVAKRAAARASLSDDRTNPKPAAKRGATQRAPSDDQTNRSAAKRSASDDRTNPSPVPKRGATQRAPSNDQTNRAAAKRSLSNDRTNPRPEAEAVAAPARLHYDDAYIKGILQRVKTIAAVGMSANDMRPSYFAMLYLQQKGYRMIPVNPRYAGQEILGEQVVASLDDLPAPPDMVQIFRKSDEAPAVVDEAIRAGAKVVWLQLGIRSDEAAARARAAGLDVVMDRCPKIEYGRLFGEIGWAGVNRRVISARKGQALQLSHKKGGLARRPAPRG